MYIFVDESGIHKHTGHSSLALVYVVSPDIDQLRQRIVDIEQKLHIPSFHWTRDKWSTRMRFLQTIVDMPFSVKIAVTENPVNVREWFDTSITHFLTERDITHVIIDGEKPKWEERRLKKILRDKGVSVKKLRTVRDESEPIIRLADGLAAMIRSYHDNPHGKHVKTLHRLYYSRNKITAQLVDGQTTG